MTTTQTTEKLIKMMGNVSASFLNYDNVEYQIIRNNDGKIIKLLEVEED